MFLSGISLADLETIKKLFLSIYELVLLFLCWQCTLCSKGLPVSVVHTMQHCSASSIYHDHGLSCLVCTLCICHDFHEATNDL